MNKIKIFITIFLCILFIPFLVHAEECNPSNIKIKDIDIKDKSEYVEELSDTTFKDNKLNLDLKMYDVGDYIEYELKVKNDSNEDYYLNKDSLDINSDYFEYFITFSDNSNKIEPNTEKTIYLRVEYKKEVEKDKFLSGKYVSNNMVTLKSSTNNTITNPLTKNNKLTIFLFILLVIQLVLYFTRSKRINKTMILLIGILLPFEVFALCNFELDINSNITIGKVKPNPCTYDGELVQGAEYVNGQYTYRYMQEGNGSDWNNIENDGWGVMLTDKESTDDVTTKLCTSINDKPIVSMSFMFGGSKTNKIDLDSFDTSSVTNMTGMFAGQVNINKLNLKNFDTSNVINMSIMFIGATSLEEVNLDGFDLTSSINESSIIRSMFYGTNNLKRVSLKNWKIPEIFTNAIGCRNSSLCSKNLEYVDVTGWDLSNTKDVNGLFGDLYAREIKGLNTWDISNLENMSYMLTHNEILEEINIENWNGEKLRNISYMFYNNSSLKKVKINIKNTSNLVNMSCMFLQDPLLEEVTMDGIDLTASVNGSDIVQSAFEYDYNLKKVSVRNWKIPDSFIYGMSGHMGIILISSNLEYIDVTGWDLSQTTDISCLFLNSGVQRIIGLDTWDTSNIKNMKQMFYNAYNVQELDLSSFDTRKVTNMSHMFTTAGNVKTIFASDKFNTDNVINSEYMFGGMSINFVGGNGTVFDSIHIDKEYARIDAPGSPGYFTRK